jgi:hypothetical protein
MNLWIENYLKEFVNGQQDNWSTLLPIAEFAHNSWKHEHTKYTPHQLILGINPSANLSIKEDTNPSAYQRLLMIKKARSDAQQSLSKRIKHYTPKRTLSPGDKVMLDSRNLKVNTPSRKLSPRRYGPFKVLKQISPVAYRIELPPSMKIHNVFHIDLLIPYNETEAYGETYTQPPPEIIDGEEEYEIEEIINTRRTGKNKKMQYLVRWKGYPSADNQWVDAKDVHAPELLEEYLSAKV